MPSQLPDPTKAERRDMEMLHLGYPCLIERHALCGARYGLLDGSDRWLPCQCFCHDAMYAQGVHNDSAKLRVRDVPGVSKLWRPGR